MKVETIENGVVITVDKKENYTLEDLKQKVINYLYNKKHYEEDETKLLSVLLEHEKNEDIVNRVDKIETKVFGHKLGSIGTITVDSITAKVKEN